MPRTKTKNTAKIFEAEQVPEPNIGERLKKVRTRRKLRLRDLAEQAGCSESLISKIENGKANPSLKILHRISSVLDTNISELFARGDELDRIVMRNGTRPVIVTDQVRRGEGIRLERLIPHSDAHMLQGNIHHVAPGGCTESNMQHEGEEVGYIIEGELELQVNDQVFLLREGDSFFFRSELGHGYRNPGTGVTRVIWVNTPPTF